MTPEKAIEELESISEELCERVSEFPDPTCPIIDRVLAEVKDAGREADRWERMRSYDMPEDDISDFARQMDDALRDLPDQLEALRKSNDELRTALHDALKSRKRAVERINEICANLDTSWQAEKEAA